MYSYSTAISIILTRVPVITGEPLQIFGLISTKGCSVFVCKLDTPGYVYEFSAFRLS